MKEKKFVSCASVRFRSNGGASKAPASTSDSSTVFESDLKASVIWFLSFLFWTPFRRCTVHLGCVSTVSSTQLRPCSCLCLSCCPCLSMPLSSESVSTGSSLPGCGDPFDFGPRVCPRYSQHGRISFRKSAYVVRLMRCNCTCFSRSSGSNASSEVMRMSSATVCWRSWSSRLLQWRLTRASIFQVEPFSSVNFAHCADKMSLRRLWARSVMYGPYLLRNRCQLSLSRSPPAAVTMTKLSTSVRTDNTWKSCATISADVGPSGPRTSSAVDSETNILLGVHCVEPRCHSRVHTCHVVFDFLGPHVEVFFSAWEHRRLTLALLLLWVRRVFKAAANAADRWSRTCATGCCCLCALLATLLPWFRRFLRFTFSDVSRGMNLWTRQQSFQLDVSTTSLSTWARHMSVRRFIKGQTRFTRVSRVCLPQDTRGVADSSVRNHTITRASCTLESFWLKCQLSHALDHRASSATRCPRAAPRSKTRLRCQELRFAVRLVCWLPESSGWVLIHEQLRMKDKANNIIKSKTNKRQTEKTGNAHKKWKTLKEKHKFISFICVEVKIGVEVEAMVEKEIDNSFFQHTDTKVKMKIVKANEKETQTEKKSKGNSNSKNKKSGERRKGLRGWQTHWIPVQGTLMVCQRNTWRFVVMWFTHWVVPSTRFRCFIGWLRSSSVTMSCATWRSAVRVVTTRCEDVTWEGTSHVVGRRERLAWTQLLVCLRDKWRYRGRYRDRHGNEGRDMDYDWGWHCDWDAGFEWRECNGGWDWRLYGNQGDHCFDWLLLLTIWRDMVIVSLGVRSRTVVRSSRRNVETQRFGLGHLVLCGYFCRWFSTLPMFTLISRESQRDMIIARISMHVGLLRRRSSQAGSLTSCCRLLSEDQQMSAEQTPVHLQFCLELPLAPRASPHRWICIGSERRQHGDKRSWAAHPVARRRSGGAWRRHQKGAPQRTRTETTLVKANDWPASLLDPTCDTK